MANLAAWSLQASEFVIGVVVMKFQSCRTTAAFLLSLKQPPVIEMILRAFLAIVRRDDSVHPYSRTIPVLVDEADRLLVRSPSFNTVYDDERVVLDVPPPLPATLVVTVDSTIGTLSIEPRKSQNLEYRRQFEGISRCGHLIITLCLLL
jgi:hypothetical protein